MTHKSHILVFFCASVFLSLFFFSCSGSVSPQQSQENQENSENQDDLEIEIDGIPAAPFFWGTWVRMDNGQEYEVLETKIKYNNSTYDITASDETSLTVQSLGTFNKESDSVIVCNQIPYFRKGGANLEYSLKLVGFASDSSRAAGSGLSGIKGRGRSNKYKGFSSNAESDNDGILKFKAPTANDTQTVTINYGDNTVVIPELVIKNSGDYMGTVALVDADDYNLKITGEISDKQKDDGYLFGNNAKAYDMVLTITNISDNKCTASGCIIQTEDPNLKLYSDDTILSGFAISTLASGATKTINLTLEYGTLTQPYVDTGITVTIKNPSTKQEWKDYIPLRFFKGTMPITIAAKNPDNNTNAALNGFIIYPDGNAQFFAINHDSSKSIYVPTFGNEKPYKLVFSGATVTSNLSESTEMFYTVLPSERNSKTVVTGGANLASIMTFGGNNHSEDTAYVVEEGFEAYLKEGEIDYFSIKADSENVYGPAGSNYYTVSFSTDKGDVPESFEISGGSTLSSMQLPEIKTEGYRFMGWYAGTQKVEPRDYVIKSDTTLTAKWQVEYKVTYVSQYGEVPDPIYMLEGESLAYNELPTLKESGWQFDGWYSDGEKLDPMFYATYPVTKNMTLTAKWLELFTITFETKYGKKPDALSVSDGKILYSSELPRIYEKDKKLAGWYTDSGFSDSTKVASITVTENKTLYAKWTDAGMVMVKGGTFTIGNPEDTYNIAHKVSVSSFLICDHEVTEEEYFDFCISGLETRENYPVRYIKWQNAIMYCNLRSLAEGLTPCYSYSKLKEKDPSDITTWFIRRSEKNPKDWDGVSVSSTKCSWEKTPVDSKFSCDWSANGYRLPTEAEWEFAARGGLDSNGYKYSGSNSIDSVAWYRTNSDMAFYEIKTKSPNELGLYDMSGNVSEWCWDTYEKYENRIETNPRGGSPGGVHVVRGGAYNCYADDCTVYDRSYDNSVTSYPFYGFRVVRNAQD